MLFITSSRVYSSFERTIWWTFRKYKSCISHTIGKRIIILGKASFIKCPFFPQFCTQNIMVRGFGCIKLCSSASFDNRGDPRFESRPPSTTYYFQHFPSIPLKSIGSKEAENVQFWQSGRFQHHKTRVRIQSSANFVKPLLSVNCL